jgi:outer membrane lipoprotein carrier protein
MIFYGMTMTYGRLMRRLHLLLAVWLLAGSQGRAGQAVQDGSPAYLPPVLGEIIPAVENQYNRMKSMKARFNQTLRRGTAIIRREEGTLYLSKPGRMRWEYESPEVKLFLTVGNRMILYIPAENRVMETAVKETSDLRAPLRFLLGRLNFQEEFRRMETSPQLRPVGTGNVVFKAYPTRLAERLDWVLFEISPGHLIHRVVVAEKGGIETEFRFFDEQVNIAVPDSLFKFEFPAGAEVIRE